MKYLLLLLVAFSVSCSSKEKSSPSYKHTSDELEALSLYAKEALAGKTIPGRYAFWVDPEDSYVRETLMSMQDQGFLTELEITKLWGMDYAEATMQWK